MKSIARAATVLALCTAAQFAGAIDWRWRYRTLTSPHFEVIFRDTQRPYAKHLLLAAERAHELVFPIFGEGPARTILVVQDDTDESNGEANFLPYPHIRLYPVLPTVNGGLGEYGDWALELMVHEYTHILNMYPAHGFYQPLKYVFGTILRPNAVLPKWYLEGLAVDLESALTSGGRLRAIETAAAARALSLGHRFAGEDIARINEQQILTWPYGSRPYLYGGWWWETTVQHGAGLKLIGDLNQAYARRLPFLIEGPLARITGADATDHLNQTARRLEAKAAAEIARVDAAGPPAPTRPVVAQTGEQSIFAISPSGKHLVYWLGEPGLPAAVNVRTRDDGAVPFADVKPRKLFNARGTVQVRWLDDDRFVFDQVDVRRPYVSYRDLYIYDLNTRATKRLTTAARAQEAAPSPSAKRLVFVRNSGGQNALHLVDLDTGATRRLVGGNFLQRLSGPEFIAEDRVAFSLRTRDGRETLKTFDLNTRAVGDWQPTLKYAQNLRRTGAGFLVSDAGTGVRNVYAIDAAADAGGRGTPRAMTNSRTDADRADYDPRTRELIFSELGPDGRRLVQTAFAPARVANVPRDTLPPPPPVPRVKFTSEEHGFHPLSYLRPRYWIPMAYQVENGVMLQGQTAGADPIGRNSYDLSGSIDTVTRKPSYVFNFANESLPVRLRTGYGKMQTFLGASGRALESQRAYLKSSQFWPFNTRQISWTVGGVWLDTASTTTSYRRMGPTLGFGFSNLDSPLGAWHAVQFSADHSEYLRQRGYYDYGRTSVHLSQTARLGRGHHVSVDARGVFSPRLPLNRTQDLGERNVGGNYLVNLVNSDLMLRGYSSGTLIGRKVVNANVEYAFPLIPLARGFGTKPLFLRNLEIALFTDLMAVDGAAYNTDLRGFERTSLSRFFAGTGAEARVSTTVAYHLPFSLTLGLYYGTDRAHGGGFAPFIGMGIGQLEGLKTKTP